MTCYFYYGYLLGTMDWPELISVSSYSCSPKCSVYTNGTASDWRPVFSCPHCCSKPSEYSPPAENCSRSVMILYY